MQARAPNDLPSASVIFTMVPGWAPWACLALRLLWNTVALI